MAQNFHCSVKVKVLAVELWSYFALKEQVADCCLLNETQMESGLVILIL